MHDLFEVLFNLASACRGLLAAEEQGDESLRRMYLSSIRRWVKQLDEIIVSTLSAPP